MILQWLGLRCEQFYSCFLCLYSCLWFLFTVFKFREFLNLNFWLSCISVWVCHAILQLINDLQIHILTFRNQTQLCNFFLCALLLKLSILAWNVDCIKYSCTILNWDECLLFIYVSAHWLGSKFNSSHVNNQI